MGHIATKLTHCLVAAVLLFCAAVVPFTPAADDFDENLGLASVQTLVSTHSVDQASVSRSDPHIFTKNAAAVTSLPGTLANSAHAEPQPRLIFSLFQPPPPLRT